MAYVYQHIRLDKNEPFYIGISNSDKNYSRAYSKSKSHRNSIWFKIYEKTNYKVEILEDRVPFDEARKKEIELIKKYGRIDLGTGILSNMTDGGDGTINVACKYRLKVIQKAMDGEIIKIWDSILDTEKVGNYDMGAVYNACIGKTNQSYGFKWEFVDDEKRKIAEKNRLDRKRKTKEKAKQRIAKSKVVQKTLNGDIVRIWDSTSEASRHGFNSGAIYNVCSGRNRTHKNFLWEFFDEEIKLKKYKNILVETGVVQKDMNGQLLKVWKNFVELKNSGYEVTGIQKCCRGVQRQARGYKWEYLNGKFHRK